VVRIAVLDDYQGIAGSYPDWSRLPSDASVDFLREHLEGDDTCAERLAGYDVIMVIRERTPFPRSLLSRLPNLKMLIATGRRHGGSDFEYARELGITVTHADSGPPAERPREGPPPGGIGDAGELTWGLIFAVVRQIPREAESVRNGGWQTSIGPGLRGKTLGIVGLGNIGAGMARIGRAFGMNVIAWSQNLTPERAAEHGATWVPKDQLFSESDIVTIHYHLSERSRGIVGAHELSLMKPAAYLINTSRGPLVDEAALIEALRARRIAGAALDVFDQEPMPPDHPLRTLDNVVATPHIGFVTTEAYRGWYKNAVDEILAFMAGQKAREPVS
jgi:phosphoglycerate dehydrogenase-like enzyme